MKYRRVSSTWQIYFFLYLAVLCEILIIIVERDDAEAAWERERSRLVDLNRKVITELLSTLPILSATGDNQLRVGETKDFDISIKGLGRKDSVRDPVVQVHRNGAVLDTFKVSSGGLREISRDSVTGEIRYRFTWTASVPGTYVFLSNTGTDRISLMLDGNVRVGSLVFSRQEIERYGDLAKYISETESLSDSLVVDVVPGADPLFLRIPDIVTAAGYPASVPLTIEGTSPGRIHALNASNGNCLADGEGGWLWRGEFNSPGLHTVNVNAVDNRGSAALSRTQASFTVDARSPLLVRKPPSTAWAGEEFVMNVRVAGLDVLGDYRWFVSLGGKLIGSGNGATVRYTIPSEAAGKLLDVKSTYRGRSYPVLLAEGGELRTSGFEYTVMEAPVRLVNMSFSRGMEYPAGTEFRFTAIKCGRCLPANRRNPEPSSIYVYAEDDMGRDMLDEFGISPTFTSNGNESGTEVWFTLLDEKVGKNDCPVRIGIRAGSSFTEHYDVVLFRPQKHIVK